MQINNKIILNLSKSTIYKWGLGIGDWGLGIGDWAQSPNPNSQSPVIKINKKNLNKLNNIKLIYNF